jgi:ParB/RepB/Spo0J family partition protein
MASMIAMNKILVASNVRRFEGIEDLATAPLESFPTEFQERVKDLAESIRERGLINPLTVKDLGRGERFRLIAGFRRFKALQLLGKKQVDVKSIKGRTEDEIVIQLAENVQREDMNPMDVVKGLTKQKDIADLIGKSEAWVTYHLQLLKADDSVKEAVKSGDMSMRAAREMSSLSKDEQREVVESSREPAPSGPGKVSFKAAQKKTAEKKKAKKSKQQKLPLRPVADRQSEQKQDMIDKFVEAGGTDLDKAQRLEADREGMLGAFWDFLFANDRLFIKAD